MARIERLFGIAQVTDENAKKAFGDTDEFIRDTNESLGSVEAEASKGFAPLWAGSTRYALGQLVYLDNVLWRANVGHLSGTSLVAQIALWDALSVGYPLALQAERVIGRNWVNSLPIYDQAFQQTLAASPGTTTAAHGITNLDMDGFTEFIGNSSSDTPRLFPWSPYSQATVGVLLYADATNFVMQHQNATHDSAIVNVVLRYQKTS